MSIRAWKRFSGLAIICILAALDAGAAGPLDVRRSLAVTDVEILNKFTFKAVMQQVVTSSGDATATPESLFRQWWDTQNPDGDSEGDGPHCNDEMRRLPNDDDLDNTSDSALREGLVATFNNFPFTCPRPEGRLASRDPYSSPDSNPDAYIPIGLFNRFDLAHPAGKHCGEYRIIFAKRSGTEKRILANNQRNLIIFEAQLPNPSPAKGLEGCRPVVEFWESLTRLEKPADRAALLKKFYFEGIPGKNVLPVIDAKNLGYSVAADGKERNGGQIRTNQFIDGTVFPPLGRRPAVHWMLREFKTVVDCHCGPCRLSIIQQPVARNPWGRLFGRTRWHPEASEFQRALPDAIKGLGGTNINALDYHTPQTYDSGQSVMDAVGVPIPWRSFQNDYVKNFQRAPASFRAAMAVAGLTPEAAVARVQALSCAGCHELSSGQDIGGRKWPEKSINFVHVTEQEFETGTPKRFKISEVLTNEFLPHRASVMTGFLSKTLRVSAAEVSSPGVGSVSPAARAGACPESPSPLPAAALRAWTRDREAVIGGRGVH